MQLARQFLTLVTPFVLLFAVLWVALRYEAVAVVVALAGVAGTAWGLWYLMGALSPDNSTNELRELGVAFGIAPTVAGGLLVVAGVWTGTVAATRRRARASSDRHP